MAIINLTIVFKDMFCSNDKAIFTWALMNELILKEKFARLIIIDYFPSCQSVLQLVNIWK